jgi:hypothetical protein
MEELDALNQTEQPEMPPEIVVVELPEEELQEMQDTQVATLKLVRQMATEMPRLTREIELQNFTRVLSENAELQRQNSTLEVQKTRAQMELAGRENERSIEQTERRIATELDELVNRMQNLWITVFVTIGSSIALSAIVWIILFTLLR